MMSFSASSISNAKVSLPATSLADATDKAERKTPNKHKIIIICFLSIIFNPVQFKLKYMYIIKVANN